MESVLEIRHQRHVAPWVSEMSIGRSRISRILTIARQYNNFNQYDLQGIGGTANFFYHHVSWRVPSIPWRLEVR